MRPRARACELTATSPRAAPGKLQTLTAKDGGVLIGIGAGYRASRIQILLLQEDCRGLAVNAQIIRRVYVMYTKWHHQAEDRGKSGTDGSGRCGTGLGV